MQLAAALQVEWDALATLQAELQLQMAATDIDATVAATLSSVQYMDLDPVVIGWSAQASLVLVEQAIEYLDLDPTVVDWDALAALVSVGMAEFATALGWSQSATLEAVRGIDMSPAALMWSASAALGVVRPLDAPRTLSWSSSATLVALLGLSVSQAWSWTASATLLARLMLSASSAFSWSGSATLELIPGTLPIEYVSSASAAAATVTMPTHQAGDLIVCCARRATGAPGLPAGWTNLAQWGSGSSTARVGYKYAASGSESTGTWTSSGDVAVAVYRNAQLGVYNTYSGISGKYPDLSGYTTDAWLLRWAASSTFASQPSTPSGFTSRQGDSGRSTRLSDTDGPHGSTSISETSHGGTYVNSAITLALEPA